ncbi:unnamed protein product [Sphenostylis stenocarpa]|uniref:Uncharacterized protein n=1 Tax=Sphenostylis stenocarpa TaxID=92480 RepID=A0AA86SCQ3_9FABA|nr:unnamed protein product [Sphenostylis stenocarpa]
MDKNIITVPRSAKSTVVRHPPEIRELARPTERHARRQSFRSAAGTKPPPPMRCRRRRIRPLRRALRRIPRIRPLLRRFHAEIRRRRRRQPSIPAPASPSVGSAFVVTARGENRRKPRRRRRRPFLARFLMRDLRLVRSGAKEVREVPEPSAVPPLLGGSASVVRGGVNLRRAEEEFLSVEVAVGFPVRDVGRYRAREIERRWFLLLRLGLVLAMMRCVSAGLGLGLDLGCEDRLETFAEARSANADGAGEVRQVLLTPHCEEGSDEEFKGKALSCS